MDKANELKLISDLKDLNQAELLSLLYKVFSPVKKVRAEFGEVDDAICIAICGYSERDGSYESDYWALPVEGIESYSVEQQIAGAVEFGECPRCKASITSIGKVAICPICDTEVECT